MLENDKKIEIGEEIIEVCGYVEPKKILMVVTNVDHLDENHKTGVTFIEFAKPYLDFVKVGYIVTVASLRGGVCPIDPSSENLIEDIEWKEAKKTLHNTAKLDTIDFALYDAIILSGGYGAMVDLAYNKVLGDIIQYFDERDKLIAAICHGSAGLLGAKKDDIPFVDGKRLTCFSNEEEILSKKDKIVPFFLEDALKEQGCFYIQTEAFSVNVVEDGNLITAQNPKSSEGFAGAIIKYLNNPAS